MPGTLKAVQKGLTAIVAGFRRLYEAPFDRNAFYDIRIRLEATAGECGSALQAILLEAEAMAARGPLGVADPQVQGQVRKLEGEIRELKARNIVLEAELRQKDEKLKEAETRGGAPRADSSNSNMPGSLVIGGGSKKSKKEAGLFPRKRGPRHGHEPACREPFKEGEDGVAVVEHEDPNGGVCPCRGGRLERSPEHDGVHDQYELKERIAEKLIHKSKAYKCPKCRKLFNRSVPLRIAGTGLAGVSLLEWILVMKVAGHNSVRQIVADLEDVSGVKMSQGAVNNALKRGTRAFLPAFLELLHILPPARAAGVDETRPRRRGKDALAVGLRDGEGGALPHRPPLRRNPGAGPEGFPPARDLLRPLLRVREMGEGASRPGSPALPRPP
jgi:hypothetical protein